MNKIRTAVVAIGALGLLGAGFGTAEASLIATKTSSGVINSPTQAGYVVVPKAGGTVTSFNLVEAVFTVPALNCSTNNDSESSQEIIVGENGVRKDTDCTGIPSAPAFDIFGLSECNGHSGPIAVSIKPGDNIKVSADALTGIEQAANLTTGEVARNSGAIACGAADSAGVITIGVPSSIGVTNFTQIGFRQVQVQGTNQSAPQPLGSTAWNVREYALKGPSGRVDVKPEALLTGKFTSAFANDWLSPN